MRTITIIAVTALSFAISAPTHAQYYGGLPLNSIRGTLPSDAGNLLFGSRFFSGAESLDNGGTDLKFGYRFSASLLPHIAQLALVGQYADANRWGGRRVSFDGSPAAPKTSSYGLDLVSTLPIFDRLSLTGNAGIARVRADTVFGGALPIGLLGSSDGRYTSASRMGLGVQYDFNRSLGLKFGVERYRNLGGSSYGGMNADADTFTFGLRIRF
jgi:opacity protein-like surface antigen